MMEGRRYSDGLHQALEAKENGDIGNITQTYATITLQNYFQDVPQAMRYDQYRRKQRHRNCGKSTSWMVVIPTNKPVIRKDEEDLVFKTTREKSSMLLLMK